MRREKMSKIDWKGKLEFFGEDCGWVPCQIVLTREDFGEAVVRTEKAVDEMWLHVVRWPDSSLIRNRPTKIMVKTGWIAIRKGSSNPGRNKMASVTNVYDSKEAACNVAKGYDDWTDFVVQPISWEEQEA